jgi:hypothetical protein
MFGEFWQGNCNYESLISRYIGEQIEWEDIYKIFDSRNYILQSIADLGLKLYGENWDKENGCDLVLMSMFDKTPVFSLKHNQDVYNSSKICLSVSHPQTRGWAFPWRCYDIMASDGLLICSYSGLLRKTTQDLKFKIPMYESPYQTRELCQKYLKEPNLRQDTVFASNEFIEKNGRWENNFRKLQEFLKIKLINENKNGNIYFIDNSDDSNDNRQKNFNKKRLGLKNKIRYYFWRKLNEKLKSKNII